MGESSRIRLYGKVLTRRKPMALYRIDEISEARLAERQDVAAFGQPPPRFTRVDPDVAPDGSEPPGNVLPDQSKHHSNTFPCVSYSPQAFG